eukprot:15441650-Alexandrium_andersonii.AAC.1
MSLRASCLVGRAARAMSAVATLAGRQLAGLALSKKVRKSWNAPSWTSAKCSARGRAACWGVLA